jgi:hypothetical protein
MFKSKNVSISQGAVSCVATEEILGSLWNLYVRYRAHKSPPVGPVLNQVTLVYTTPPCLSKIYLNIIHPPTSLWPLYFRLKTEYKASF